MRLYRMSTTQQIVTNCYIEMTVLHNKRVFTELSSLDFITTNQPIEFNEFTTKLADHEKKYNYAAKSKRKIRYGITLSFLLDKDRPAEELSELCSKIGKRYNDLPFYAWRKHEGKGTYLIMYFSERYFYPEGTTISVYSERDRFRSKKTGRICTTDNPDAVCFIRKGDFVKNETVYFSKKVDTFKFASVYQFEVIMNKLKVFFIRILERVCAAVLDHSLTFKRFVLKCLSFNKRKQAAKWNKAIVSIEKQLDDAVYALQMCDCYDKIARKEIEKLYSQYADYLTKGNFRYDRYSVKISFGFRTPGKLESALDLFNRKFKEDLNKMMIRLIPLFY